MIKNSLKFSTLVFLMTGALVVPAKAASTEVTIGVTEVPPKVVSVDVPKSFAIAVVADQRIPEKSRKCW